MSMRIGSSFELSQLSYSSVVAPEQENSVFGQRKESVDTVNTARERYKAMQIKGENGEPVPGQLIYHKAKVVDTYLLGFKISSELKPAYYEYITTGKETIFQIKKRFGIKDGAFYRYDERYSESNSKLKETTEQCWPSPGTILRFYAHDVQ